MVRQRRARSYLRADFAAISVSSLAKSLDVSHPLTAFGKTNRYEVECKGTADGRSISKQAGDIRAKKSAQSRRPAARLGTILAIQATKPVQTRILVYDPSPIPGLGGATAPRPTAGSTI